VYLNWEDGLPLNKFISLICYDSNQSPHDTNEQTSVFDEAVKRSQIFAELERRRTESTLFKSKV
jgi:hypothetical protein